MFLWNLYKTSSFAAIAAVPQNIPKYIHVRKFIIHKYSVPVALAVRSLGNLCKEF